MATDCERFCDWPLPVVDQAEIERQYRALAPPYAIDQWVLPLPVWGHRPYDYGPVEAWEILRHELSAASVDRPFCIYLHVPFCSSKCSFCDSYSFKLGANQDKHRQAYLERLCYEIDLWGRQGNLSRRPVSTIHLGGGTPAFLGARALRQLVDTCQATFNVSTQTEWALESTVESLDPQMTADLHQLGFRRLHIGVQSLQDEVRAAIGRRCSAQQTLDAVQRTLDLDWVVSVDMICGLPGQTLAGLIADLRALIETGINGVSLYELLIFPQNRRWAESQGLTRRSHLPNYCMFQAGAALLQGQGFSKNLFNHWADGRDQNIYFTFPLRGEDCLALGTLADGVFGDFHYRHKGYAPYLRTAQSGLPGLEGGLRRTPFENLMHPVHTLLLSGQVPAEVARPLAQACAELLRRWQSLALIESDSEGGFYLTTSGSWFVGNLIRELTEHYRKIVDLPADRPAIPW